MSKKSTAKKTATKQASEKPAEKSADTGAEKDKETIAMTGDDTVKEVEPTIEEGYAKDASHETIEKLVTPSQACAILNETPPNLKNPDRE